MNSATTRGSGWSFAGARRLKGIKGEVKLYRARPWRELVVASLFAGE